MLHSKVPKLEPFGNPDVGREDCISPFFSQGPITGAVIQVLIKNKYLLVRGINSYTLV